MEQFLLLAGGVSCASIRLRVTRTVAACGVAALALGCAGARGQVVRIDPTTRVEAPPLARVDVDIGAPGVIVPLGVGIPARGAVGAGLRVMSRPGFGGGVRLAGSPNLSFGGPPTSVVTAHAHGWVVDIAAIYRLRPFGDDRRGLGIDLALGASVGAFEWDAGSSAYDHSCGFIQLNCDAVVVTPYVSPPQAFTSGRRVGPFVGVGVDIRERGFVFGLNAGWRALVYDGELAPVPAEPLALHLFSAILHAGFGFSL